MEIHHEFRAGRKEPKALQQLNKELWEMNMGLKEINKTPGDINTGLRDIKQKPGNKKTFRVKNTGKQKEVQGNNKAMKIASNFTRILTNENVSPDSSCSCRMLVLCATMLKSFPRPSFLDCTRGQRKAVKS